MVKKVAARLDFTTLPLHLNLLNVELVTSGSKFPKQQK